MSKKNICLLLLFIVHFCNSQNNQKYKLEKDFFLLGTLSDYMGRYKNPLQNDLVDCYNTSEKMLLFHNYKCYKNEIKDLKLDTVNRTLKSIELTTRINTYFNWKYDETITNENDDSLFIGNINFKKFKTKNQKMSFLLGVYTRYGDRNDTIYCIRIANSNTLYETSLKILKDLNCKNVISNIIEAVPSNYLIYFQPNDRLKKYLEYYRFMREEIWDKNKK